MLIWLLLVLAAAAISPWLVPWLAKQGRVALLSVVPAGLFLAACVQVPEIISGAVVVQSHDWMPSLGLSLSFYLDGLSLLFVLLITGIGTFIVLYASDYLKGHQDLGRFYWWLLAFMASMLGLVMADNLLLLFVFWELTSITSYMLIGFNHESAQSRKFALQGLFITVGGGLLLMTGVIMLSLHYGTLQLSEIVQKPLEADGPWVDLMLLCLLAGAFTKSAQFPFHFWLPNAMAAPTPVSAFLHSATMVKAGVFLMARLEPSLGDQWLWSNLQLLAGAATMLLGAFLSYVAVDLKKALAYSTLMALGTLTFLLGLESDKAIIAFVAFLLAHSLYKASLFMLAGAIDHSAGTKDLSALGGLRQTMPVTFVLMMIAAASLAGLPPVFGFIAKELLLEASLNGTWLPALSVFITACLTVGVAFVLAIKPFLGARGNLPKAPHEASVAMLAGPTVLLLLSIIFGLLPWVADKALIQAAVLAIAPNTEAFYLALWHGVNLPLLMSFIAIIAGLVLAQVWQKTRPMAQGLGAVFKRFGPEALYFKLMAGLVAVAAWQTRFFQNGRLGNYMSTIIVFVIVLVGYTLLTQHGLPGLPELSPINLYEVMIVALLAVSTLFAVITRARFTSIVSLGATGYSVALIFVYFSAPDLGITQVLVETLTVLLLVLVLVKVPGFSQYSGKPEIIRDAIIALAMGGLMTLLVLAVLNVQWAPSIAEYFIENSYELGRGRNIVNVILVDFRGLDTLGEIFVLAIAALGVYSMVRLRKVSQ